MRPISCEVRLTNGQVALVDEGDLAKVVDLRWYLHGAGYAIAHAPGAHRVTYMHRLVLDAPAGLEVDHINRVKLDNRRANLRLVTRHQQMRNLRPRSDSQTGLKGVAPSRCSDRFCAYIGSGPTRRHLGTFDTAVEAALAYDQAARDAYGEHAYLNFPDRLAS